MCAIGLVLANVGSYAQTITVGRPIVILVHGRGLQGLPPDSVGRAWISAVREGQAKIGFSPFKDDDIKLVWYGSALMNVSCRETLSGANADGRSLLQRIAEIVARLPAIEQALGRAVIADTQEYFSDGCYSGQIDWALRDELERAKIAKRPVVLIAHSMGSLVAFRVLTQKWVPTEDESVAFVTIGSMLGMEQMPKALLGAYVESPVPVPQVVTTWINVRNDGDLLSFSSLGKFRSRVPTRMPVDVRINFTGTSRHSAENYLRDTTVAKVIADAWCNAISVPEHRPAVCSHAVKASREPE